MSAASNIRDRAGFTIGGVIGRTLGLLRQNPGALIALAVVLSGVLPLLGGFAYSRLVIAIFGRDQFLRLVPFQALILLPVTLIPSIIPQGSLIHLAVSGERGWALGASLRTALRVFFPNLGIYVLAGLAVIVGSILLVVPGRMLMCRYAVVLPAEVVERTGVSGALTRSP